MMCVRVQTEVGQERVSRREEEAMVKCNSCIKVIYDRVWDRRPFCILDYEHIFLSQTSPPGDLGNKSHPGRAGALAYLCKDSQAPHKGQCKPQDTPAGLVSKYAKRFGNPHISQMNGGHHWN